MPYADLNNLLADYLPEAKSQKEKDAIARILDSVSSLVDTHCQRKPGFFNPSPEEPTIRRVRGEGHKFLRLPIYVIGSIESVTLNGTVIDPATYYVSDKNGWLYLEENNTFLSERSFNDYFCHRWYDGIIYKVEARWGYTETPKDLSEAVREIVVQFWNAARGVFGQITPTDFVINQDIPPSAKLILDKYKRREFEI